MSTIRERIQLAAAENTKLHQTIFQTAHVIWIYQQNPNQVENIKQEIHRATRQIAHVFRATEKHHEECKKYMDSLFRHLGFYLIGKEKKYDARITELRNKWRVAQSLEVEGYKILDSLNENLCHAMKAREVYFAAVRRHGRAVMELDALYEGIFGGPTPGMPEEDDKEGEVGEAQGRFDAAQLFLSTEQQVRDALRVADTFLMRAIFDLEDAQHEGGECRNVSGMFPEYTVDSALTRCKEGTSQAEMLISQAQRIQPAVKNIGHLPTALIEFLSNIFLGNLNFSDPALHNTILDWTTQISCAQSNLRNEIQAADDRISVARAQVEQEKLVLDGKKGELYRIRAAAFVRLGVELEMGVRMDRSTQT